MMEWDNVYSTADADPVFWSEKRAEAQGERICLTVNIDCQRNQPLIYDNYDKIENCN